MTAFDLVWTWNHEHQTWTVHPVEEEPRNDDFLAALRDKDSK